MAPFLGYSHLLTLLISINEANWIISQSNFGSLLGIPLAADDVKLAQMVGYWDGYEIGFTIVLFMGMSYQ
jgi:hypothetical protein